MGSLLGLAAGDALGTTLEFKRPGSFMPLDDMAGGGPFGLRPGQWTDDTSMALCLATSLLENEGFDPADQMDRYYRWYREGYLSSTGRCFDIGNTVRGALQRYEQSGEPYSGATDRFSAGNGSIMRLAPVVLYFAGDPELAIRRAADSSRTTHGAAAAVDGCRYLAALLLGALYGEPRERLLQPHYTPVPGLWEREPLVPEIDEVAGVALGRRSRRSFAAPATSWNRWRLPYGRSPAATASARAACWPRTWATTPIRRRPSTGSLPGPTMALPLSPPPGSKSWRCGKR